MFALQQRSPSSMLKAGAVLAAVAVVSLAPISHAPAHAQASGMAGIGQAETITLRAKVAAVDQAKRTVTLTGEKGESVTLTVGPEVRNFAQIKQGDMVVARYVASVTYVVSPASAKRPADSVTVASARAKPGEMPAGGVGARVIVSGVVVGVDQQANTIRIVDPAGGPVRVIDVVTPEARQNLGMVKVGDTITGIASEAVAVAVEPAS